MLLLIINIALLFVGTILEPTLAILLLAPLLTPLAQAAGIHPIHFGDGRAREHTRHRRHIQ
jgi:TRAP-type C4-dicarboxylate transport system permease large subunit